jgi:pyruvate dehydrogenase E1 component
LVQCVAIACDRLASHFGQTGSIADLYRHYGVNAIVAAVEAISPGRPIRHLHSLV